MRNVILATAGHIDHGKTELTRALTGIDTDSLPEEKARGITIDLGFAHADIGGCRVAFIDVPGHERFVRNMLAGVGGVDLALLVVAADESVMPQTREHLAILELLGVPAGIIALTKRDLVDEEMVELVQLEVADLVRGTFLERAPTVAVSARSGAGIDALRAAIADAVGEVADRDASGPFRLHVDRSFSVRGFGSVVTGTVWSGSARVGDEIELTPRERSAKVRGIEVHGAEVEKVSTGSRAALNLSGVGLEEVERGCQLVTPELFAPASLIDVRLRLLADALPLKDLARVHVHLGASELLARVKLLGVESGVLEPGTEGFAQLRAERPVLAWPQDRFIIRSYSPVTTVGGGVVLDLPYEKHRGDGVSAAARLAELVPAPGDDRLAMLVGWSGARGSTLAELVRRSGRLPAAVEAGVAGREGADAPLVRVPGTPPRWFARAAWEQLAASALALLAEFHAREPLRDGMSREELCGRLFRADPTSGRRLLEWLAEQGRVALLGDRVADPRHEVKLSADEEGARHAIVERFRAAGLNPPATKEVVAKSGGNAAAVLQLLIREGVLVPLPSGLHIHKDALDGLRVRLAEELGGADGFTVARFKELTGTSRKFAIPLLEYLDSIRVTRRRGELREVVGRD